MKSIVVLVVFFLPSVLAYALHGPSNATRDACPFSKRSSKTVDKRFASQPIEVSGVHEYREPRPGDLRGPCPGLNALANHGYLARNGLTTLIEAIDATAEVFNMGIDLGAFLSAYSVIMDGDPLALTWSIGGAPESGLLSGILGHPTGLSGSHNKYEADASATRGDYYTHNRDASSIDINQFKQLYDLDPTHSNYDLDIIKEFRSLRFDDSLHNNPYFFYPPFAGLIATQAAFFFIPVFMSNNTESGPVLNGEVLKSFFGVGENMEVKRGQERIPENWYRRPDAYTIPAFDAMLVPLFLEYPKYIAFGGNTGTVDSFTPLNIGRLTRSVFDARTLLQGNNLMCFVYQLVMATTPDLLSGLLHAVTSILDRYVTPHFQGYSCPAFEPLDTSEYRRYPGATYI